MLFAFYVFNFLGDEKRMQNSEIEPEAFEICFAEVHSSGAEKTMHHQETEPAGATRSRTVCTASGEVH